MGSDLHRREVLQAAAAVGVASAAKGAGSRKASGPAVAPALFVSHAHPTTEHLFPLSFVLGAALPQDRVTPVYEGFHHRTLSMRSFALRT
jgi:hypothetical protein